MAKATYQGREIEVDEVEIIMSTEPWSEYQLANGNVLKHKTVMLAIMKARDVKTADGLPLFLTKTQNVITVMGTQ